jgi:hypothetical protein
LKIGIVLFAECRAHGGFFGSHGRSDPENDPSGTRLRATASASPTCVRTRDYSNMSPKAGQPFFDEIDHLAR